MRIAAAHSLAAPATTPAAPQPTPAAAWAAQSAWLVRPGSSVLGITPLDATTVQLLVADPYAKDPADQVEADHLLADSALAVLEQALHGVKLIPVTRLGYVGKERELAPAQLTFASTLPGVQRYDLVPEDLDHDGTIAPGELAHRIEVDTDADVARVDRLLKDQLGGLVPAGPVHVVVPEESWMLAPVPGARVDG